MTEQEFQKKVSKSMFGFGGSIGYSIVDKLIEKRKKKKKKSL